MRLQAADLTHYVVGAFGVSAESIERLPARLAALYRHNAGAHQRAICPAGVRIRFRSDTQRIRLKVQFGEPVRWYFTAALVVDDQATSFGPIDRVSEWEGTVYEAPDVGTRRVFDIWLPHLCPTRVACIDVDDGCAVEPAPPAGPKWLAYGDSITQGFTVSSPVLSWFARCARAVDAHGWNLGVGGARLDAEIADSLPEVDVDLVTIAYGGNDYLTSVEPRMLHDRASDLLSTMRAHWPHAARVLMSPIPVLRATTQPRWPMDDYREALESAASAVGGVAIIRGSELLSADINHYQDSSHPNDSGMAQMAQLIIPAMKSALAARPSA
ncbi:MAG: SGNH/GDSL hydrolase family protein [Verrucomicrobia bacterium]|nr:SGNH/GDSL hydrolase family protein [Verrucomicrobiota bacterium]